MGKKLGLLVDLLAITMLIIVLNEEVNRVGKLPNLSLNVNFCFLFLWASVSAFLGGFLWWGINRLNDQLHFMGESAYISGTTREPHGLSAIIWPVTTNLIVVITLIILNSEYGYMRFSMQLLIYLFFLIGSSIGSLIFYDLQIYGNRGFRYYFDTKRLSYFTKEFLLVIIWSSLISIIGFLFAGFIKMIAFPGSGDWGTALWSFIKQSGICVGLTTCAVTFCLILSPEQSRYVTVRGIIAGLFLRISLFFALFLFDKI
jgi:hypothetical protein